MTKSKKESERIHFKQRLLERYGILISDTSVNKLCQEIRECKYVCVEKQSNRLKKYILTIKDTEVIAIYDKKRGMLVTALPKHD